METWKDLDRYDGAYSVSNIGRVRSNARTVQRSSGPQRIPERILKPALLKMGYLVVTLYPPGGGVKNSRTEYVHRLVLEAFVGPCPDNMEALHENDVKVDNRVENLRWGTSSENKMDIVRNGNHGMARKTHCKNEHPFVSFNLDPGTFNRTGRRICRACKLESGNARTAKRPFSVERSWIRYQELLEKAGQSGR